MTPVPQLTYGNSNRNIVESKEKKPITTPLNQSGERPQQQHIPRLVCSILARPVGLRPARFGLAPAVINCDISAVHDAGDVPPSVPTASVRCSGCSVEQPRSRPCPAKCVHLHAKIAVRPMPVTRFCPLSSPSCGYSPLQLRRACSSPASACSLRTRHCRMQARAMWNWRVRGI